MSQLESRTENVLFDDIPVAIRWNREQRWYELTTEVILPYHRDEVFGFFGDAFQLEGITPEWLNFQIRTPPPIVMQQGCLLDYQIRLHGVPLRWRTEIAHWDPPCSFMDRQLRGPYQMWEHLHTFEEVDGGTLVRDHVRYRVPGGRLTHALLVKRDLKQIFTFRCRRLQQLFRSAPIPSVG